ncbi:MAG: phosphoribosylanthranilate isomerase [Lachnospiraceae bacterium]|nr:phosphoribosylanthranilate isomerase [Lachnospiraceae bacterium]
MAKVKICGLSRLEDIAAVNLILPDYVGFIFAKSRREIDEKAAAALKEQLDPHIKTVGVFVNAGIEVIASLYHQGIIDIAQLHGDEDSGYLKLLKECLPALPLIKAVGIGNELPVLPKNADYLLFDTLSHDRGGTGKSFDWDLLRNYSGLPYFLAGGLNIGNASKAVKTLNPFCVDVSSGVETDGLKDADKIREFVRRVREC